MPLSVPSSLINLRLNVTFSNSNLIPLSVSRLITLMIDFLFGVLFQHNCSGEWLCN